MKHGNMENDEKEKMATLKLMAPQDIEDDTTCKLLRTRHE